MHVERHEREEAEGVGGLSEGAVGEGEEGRQRVVWRVRLYYVGGGGGEAVERDRPQCYVRNVRYYVLARIR